MVLLLQLYHLLVGLSIGFICASFAYYLYRRHSVILWGYLAGTLPDFPHALNFIGVTNTYTLLVITHVFGVFIFTIFLIIVDILLIELNLLKYLSPLRPLLTPLKPLFIAENIAEKLQRYGAIPRPERLKTVYVVTVISTLIHLSVNLILGVV